MAKKDNVKTPEVEEVFGAELSLEPVRHTFDSVKAEQTEAERKKLLEALIKADTLFKKRIVELEKEADDILAALAKGKENLVWLAELTKEVEDSEEFSPELTQKALYSNSGKSVENSDKTGVLNNGAIRLIVKSELKRFGL